MKQNESTLAEQREWVLTELHAQRRRVAAKLESQSQQAAMYPRSMTMRVLRHRPSLLLRLLPLLLGARRAGAVLSVLGLVRLMLGVVNEGPQAKALAAPVRNDLA